MSFFKKLKNKFVGNNEETTDPLETLAPDDTLDPQQEDPGHDVQTSESVNHAEVIEQPKKTEKKSDWEFDFDDDDLISIEEFEELEAQQIGAKFREGLEKSRENFQNKLNDLLAMYRTVDEDFFEALEEMLIQADVGFNTVMDLVESLRMEAKRRNITETADLREVIVEKIVEIYEQEDDKLQEMNIQEDGLTVILMVGVNGVGKTTTIGKLAHRYKGQGKKVMLAAGDTFRAGAIEQLQVWGDRVGVEVIKQSEGSDPAAVMYDAIGAAKNRGADILICDTAGRLQNKANLMTELEKVKKVLSRAVPGAPHEVLLALDATTGQNALVQAKAFKEVTDVSGIVLTKLDGTAKGGIVLAIRNELHIPVKFVGLGEKLDDLQPFDAESYVYGLFADMIEASTEEENKLAEVMKDNSDDE
ncbi:signal recognition particle-docking protein FtsY [Macrococcoides caseolyticum]|uniref:Signal recognition particle-docking protein FtsY n=1 Tax=Macrococcoides caseolyticum TaxID=69966 RepID=A0ACC9MVR4_9STAP|nr:signal recognition particle-docking protein FtsY [Macrococcus caseolyticus]PKE00136.1 signal recognition particle-docking protein FtsY [Macrococcus caseolyticus]PKE20461.1 signal recognition particle-docking protein FtsY [Macrococcus caseolyticus]PKE40632.1 signal recognition particle-docking protein FtsY [Macrococcus caseolyticus]PKE45229.1 signal recognition particle-docking protein FtsY [Macrococcus caseolyticus]PKE57612.1 signal recognition particle-docking protein FtsY [Macrococcus cas